MQSQETVPREGEMDTLKNQPETLPAETPKAEWKAPELQRLDVNTGTQNGYAVPSPDGGFGMS